jgi:hypothetical protein
MWRAGSNGSPQSIPDPRASNGKVLDPPSDVDQEFAITRAA